HGGAAVGHALARRLAGADDDRGPVLEAHQGSVAHATRERSLFRAREVADSTAATPELAGWPAKGNDPCLPCLAILISYERHALDSKLGGAAPCLWSLPSSSLWCWHSSSTACSSTASRGFRAPAETGDRPAATTRAWRWLP